MFSSDFVLEMLPLASVLISILASCIMLRIPIGQAVTFSTVTFVLSLFSLSPVALLIIGLNTVLHTRFLPELFTVGRIDSWNDWYKVVMFEETGSLGSELAFLLLFSIASVSLAVYLTSRILGWRLTGAIRFFSSVTLMSIVVFLVSISIFQGL